MWAVPLFARPYGSKEDAPAPPLDFLRNGLSERYYPDFPNEATFWIGTIRRAEIDAWLARELGATHF